MWCISYGFQRRAHFFPIQGLHSSVLYLPCCHDWEEIEEMKIIISFLPGWWGIPHRKASSWLGIRSKFAIIESFGRECDNRKKQHLIDSLVKPPSKQSNNPIITPPMHAYNRTHRLLSSIFSDTTSYTQKWNQKISFKLSPRSILVRQKPIESVLHATSSSRRQPGERTHQFQSNPGLP